MVFILKGKGEYQVIVLVEVLWKVCTEVIICLFKRSVELHNVLHGFREGRGTGTDTLEDKLAKHLDGLAHETIFQVFLDVRKSYD